MDKNGRPKNGQIGQHKKSRRLRQIMTIRCISLVSKRNAKRRDGANALHFSSP